MEKDQPPPYSVAAGVETHPLAGFTAPSSQQPLGQPEPYPPLPHHGYPPQPQPGYPLPPQPGYTVHPQQGATTVVVTTVPLSYGPHPQPLGCPHCHHQITSRIETEASMRTHMIALVCCLMGCIPCCLIPYCMDSCQTQNHYCPSCGAFLGTYNNDMGNRRW